MEKCCSWAFSLITNQQPLNVVQRLVQLVQLNSLQSLQSPKFAKNYEETGEVCLFFIE